MTRLITKFGLAVFVAVGLLITPALAATAHPAPTSAEIQKIVDTANAIAPQLPTRAQVATVADEQDRLFLTKILDQNEAAQRADRMTPTELEAFAADVQATTSAAQAGICPVAVAQKTAAGETQDATATAAGCSCVQQCYKEWKANLATCNGGYWCQVGFNLLFELCLADCLVPG